jgi:hypothetical protein
MKSIFTLATLVAAMLGSSVARAADWSEEFTGGFSNGWIFADDVGNIPPDATAIGIHPNNFLEMNTNANPPDLFVAGFVPANIFSNVAATASVAGGRGLLSNNDIFLTVRSNGSSGYLLNLDYASGAVDLVRVDAGAIVGLGAASSGVVPGFSAQGTYTLQMSALGSMLFGQVRDQAGVVKAIVHANDSTYAGGMTGIGAALNSSIPPAQVTPIRAGFDNVASISVAAGSSPTNPVLPSNGSAPWNFQNVPGDGRWFDPNPASGYIYETDGASNFTAVMLPLGYDLDDLYTIDDGSGPVSLAAGALYVFPTPVQSFTVSDIYLPVDGDNPLAFPTFLSFDQLQVTFTQTPVPEPSTLALLSMGAIGVVVASRKRARK